MFTRRSLFSRGRDALLAMTIPSFAAASACRAVRAAAPSDDGSSTGSFRTMPFDNPPYGAPPITFGDRSGVNVFVKTDPQFVRSLLPEPLKPDSRPWDSEDGDILMIQQNNNLITHPLRVAYPNAVVIVPASLGETFGYYMARVYEGSGDSTMLTIWGREIWGFPKIAGEVSVTRVGNKTKSSLRATNASADVELVLTDEKQAEPAADLILYCRKTIPSPDNSGPDLDRIIQVPWRQTVEQRVAANVQRFQAKIDVGGKAVELRCARHRTGILVYARARIDSRQGHGRARLFGLGQGRAEFDTVLPGTGRLKQPLADGIEPASAAAQARGLIATDANRDVQPAQRRRWEAALGEVA